MATAGDNDLGTVRDALEMLAEAIVKLSDPHFVLLNM